MPHNNGIIGQKVDFFLADEQLLPLVWLRLPVQPVKPGVVRLSRTTPG